MPYFVLHKSQKNYFLNPMVSLHLSLGSNLGNRLVYLQRAVDALHASVGMVTAISKIYETPAWGFEGAHFYNCCVIVQTSYTTKEVLHQLWRIEDNLGRTRNKEVGYTGRVIDLDILFSSEGIIATEELVVPHPLLQDRKFVLLPLAAIAPELIHPKLGLTVSALLAHTKDTATPVPVDKMLQNPKLHYNFSQVQYMVIEGNIGVGKTSLAQLMEREFNAKLLLERFEDNSFLPKFYKKPKRYAFPLALSFLADRYQQWSDTIAQHDLFKDVVVSDYHVFKSLIFAEITLSADEFRLYQRFFDILYQKIPTPELYVYLYKNSSNLLTNIRKRGRGYEQEITVAYLEKIHQGYMEFIKRHPELSVRIIDVTDRDFINNREDFIWLLEQINP